MRIGLWYKANSGKLWWLLGCATVYLAFVLRVFRLGDKDVWWDEGWAVWLARRDLLTSSLQTAADEHPPFYYWLLSGWRLFVGDSEFALRLLSVFFAVLTVALLIRIGRRSSCPSLGILAGLLLSLSRFHVWWSQEIKMYSLAIFLSMLSVYLFALCSRRNRFVLWAGYVAASVAALYTLYLTITVLVVENAAFVIVHLADHKRGRYYVQWLASQAAILLLFLPWACVYYAHAILKEPGSLDISLLFRLYTTVLPLGVSTNIERYFLPASLFFLIALVGLGSSVIRNAGREKDMAITAGLALFVPPISLALSSFAGEGVFQPKLSARYLVLFVPLFSLLLALGVRWLWRRKYPLGLLAFFLLAGLLAYTLQSYYGDRHRSNNLPALASYIAGHFPAGRAIVLNADNDWPVFAYHLGDALPFNTLPAGAKLTSKDVENPLNPVLAGHDSVWLISTPETDASDPERQVFHLLKDRLGYVSGRKYGSLRLDLFGRDDRPSLLMESGRGLPRETHVDLGGLTLVGYDSLPQSARPGDHVYVTSYWKTSGNADSAWQVRAAFVDGDGQRFWSRIRETIGGGQNGRTIQLQHNLLVGPNRPRGRYSVELKVKATGSDEGQTIKLAELMVEGTQPDHDWREFSGANFGGEIDLLGYRVSDRRVAPGRHLRITLFWRTLREPPENHVVFVQLLDETGKLWLQKDNQPVNGTYPTSVWSPGEVVKDDYVFDLPESAGAGRRQLIVGMYDLPRMTRLPVMNGASGDKQEDKVSLGWVLVKADNGCDGQKTTGGKPGDSRRCRGGDGR